MPEPSLNQEDLNVEMVDASRRAYRRRLAESVKYKAETQVGPVRHLLKVGIESLTETLEAWVEANKPGPGVPGRTNFVIPLVTSLPYEAVACVAVQTVLDQLSTPRSYLTVAYRISRAIEEEAKYACIEKKCPTDWADAIRRRNNATSENGVNARRRALHALFSDEDYVRLVGVWKPWSRRDCYRAGTLLIELLAQSTNIVKVDFEQMFKPGRKGHKRSIVVPTQECVEWLETAHERHEALVPMWLPMVVEPEPWTGPRCGGYQANVAARISLFRVANSQVPKMTREAMPKVYEAVNFAQRTEWAVNENVRQVADFLWADRGGAVAGMPGREPEGLPPTPTDRDFREETDLCKAWKRQAAIIHRRNRVTLSKRILVAKILHMAEMFSRQSFYYPNKFDFRGRLYPVAASGLSPQGNDLCRGLLMFAQAKPITTEEAKGWFYIHGANCWGADKVSFEERNAWVEANVEMIRGVSSDPFGNVSWCDASKPWQFLAWCFEAAAYWDASEAGEVFMSHLPVCMDGSNNGLQLYSLLTRDEVCGESTNVSPTSEPRDIYQDVADKATEFLRDAAQDGTVWATYKPEKDTGMTEEDVRRYSRDWLAFFGGNAPRALTKRPVMVLPYGGSLYSCREYVAEWLDDELRSRGLQDSPPFNHIYNHGLLLARIVWSAIDGMVERPQKVMQWLQSVSDAFTTAGLSLTWESPSGFLVKQSNYLARRHTIEMRIHKNFVVKRRAESPTNTLSKAKQKNGIAPNFIHTLDASILALTVLRCKEEGITSLALVHDSFGTHAADAPKLAGALRKTVHEAFSKDLLEEFKSHCEGILGVSLPDLPERGHLDIDRVLESPYFYS